jgi:hypothetical protein
MLGVGIHENVVLKNVEITEKNGKYSVDFTFKTAGSVVTVDETDPFGEAVDENGMLVTGKGGGDTTIKVWPLSVPKEDDAKGNVKAVGVRIEEANEASKELQNMFQLFARCYMTSDKIKFSRFQGIPITKDSLQMMLQEEILLKVTLNLAQQFIDMCKPFFDVEDHKLRILLRRRSEKSHFPVFRDKLLQAFPFVESMAVPKEASKIAFTRYELGKKFNDGTPVVDTDAPTDDATAPVDTASLFGGGAAAAADLSADQTMN